MAPMVATPGEAAWFRARVVETMAGLREAGVPFDESIRVGVMIEIPSAAMSADRLADHADFLSIGTNDLCQYWMAADRGNRAVADLCNPLQPSFLRLLRDVVGLARTRGIWVGVCGEMAGRVSNIPLMLGLRLDEISVAGGQILALKSRVALADAECCRALLDRACECDEPHEVEALLAGAGWCRADRATAPIVERDLIEIASDARTKEEAIKEAVDLLFVAGRTALPRDVEEAVWAREETYSTGLGHGFAVPHAKTDAVTSPTLAVLRLASPVEWAAIDDKPVRTVLLLVVPESEAAGGGGAGHMKVFARLARKLMHEAFRERLTGAASIEAIERCLRDELDLDHHGA
jgi:fructose-specific PTS system IIA-like component